jgi:hypothetical protein
MCTVAQGPLVVRMVAQEHVIPDGQTKLRSPNGGLRTLDNTDDGVRLYLNWPDGGKDLTTQITGASRGEDSALFYAFITALCMFMKLPHMYCTLSKNTVFLLEKELLLVKELKKHLYLTRIKRY